MSTEKKDEIMDLPEGKSSEEIDAIMMEDEEPLPEHQSEDDNLAQAALDATEDESPAEESNKDEKDEAEEEPEEKAKEETEEKAKEETEELSEADQQLRAKDSKIASLKHTNREVELENAKLQGKLEAQAEMRTTTEVVKSPLELAEAAYIEEKGDIEGFAMSGDLYRKQKAFDDEQTAKQTATDQTTNANTASIQAETELQQGDLSETQMGQGLDLKTVAGVGVQYLTEGDKVNIKNTTKTHGNKTALKEAYDTMIRRTLAAGNEDSKLLRNALNIQAKKPKGKTVTQKKLKTEKDVDDLITEGEPGEAESEDMSKSLYNFITT